MGQVLRTDFFTTAVKISSNTVKLPLGSYVTIGGQQYKCLVDLLAATNVSGVGGIDTGAVGVNKAYFLHIVLSAGVPALVLSLSNTLPTGFTQSAVIGTVITTDGSSNISYVGSKNGAVTIQQILSGSSTYNTPTAATRLKIRMIGAGGGGSGASNEQTGPGGNAGNYLEFIVPNPSTSYSYAVGTGGTGGSSTSGSAGGNTTFGTNQATGGNGGVINGGSTQNSANVTTLGTIISSMLGAAGITNVYGGGAGVSPKYRPSAKGGVSIFGGTASTLSGTLANGVSAPANTGAGGDSSSNGNDSGGSTGGSGGSGIIIIIEEYYA